MWYGLLLQVNKKYGFLSCPLLLPLLLFPPRSSLFHYRNNYYCQQCNYSTSLILQNEWSLYMDCISFCFSFFLSFTNNWYINILYILRHTTTSHVTDNMTYSTIPVDTHRHVLYNGKMCFLPVFRCWCDLVGSIYKAFCTWHHMLLIYSRRLSFSPVYRSCN